jgi:hypothetical protein
MHRADHIALAKALRDAATHTEVSTNDLALFADTVADVCQQRTPKEANFDRELFMAYAMSPSLPVG